MVRFCSEGLYPVKASALTLCISAVYCCCVTELIFLISEHGLFSSSLLCLMAHGHKVQHLSPTLESFFVLSIESFVKAAFLSGWIASISSATRS